MSRSGDEDGLPSWARRHLDEPSQVVPSEPVPSGGPRRGGHRARRRGPDRMRGWGLAAVAIAAAAGVVPVAVTTLTSDRDEVRLPVVDAFPAVAPGPLGAPRAGAVPDGTGVPRVEVAAPPSDVPPSDVPPSDVPPSDVPPSDVPPSDLGGQGAPRQAIAPGVALTPTAAAPAPASPGALAAAASPGAPPAASSAPAPAPGSGVVVVPPSRPTPRSGTRPAPPPETPSDPPGGGQTQQTQDTPSVREAPGAPVQRNRVAPDTQRSGDDGLVPGVFGILDQLSGPLL